MSNESCGGVTRDLADESEVLMKGEFGKSERFIVHSFRCERYGRRWL